MMVAEEKRGVEQDEAALLHRLLDTLSICCAQSVVWWDHGRRRPGGAVDSKRRRPSLKPERPAQGKAPGEGAAARGGGSGGAPGEAVKGHPLRPVPGLADAMIRFPRLTPWAILLRPSG